MSDESAIVRRWREGQQRASARRLELLRSEGPRPEQAVSEALAALESLASMGIWPGPRDPHSERAVLVVRRRWARIQRRARATARSR